MTSSRRFFARLLAALLVCSGLLLLPVAPASAAVVRPFEPVFSANTNGAILLRGNSSMVVHHEPTRTVRQREPAPSGTANNNNNFTMAYVDVDADAATFNSSRSSVSLPAGSTVLWAGLYWAGDLQQPSGGTATPSAAAYDKVKLATPQAGYVTVTASEKTTSTANNGGATPYQAFADVTAAVAAGGSGTYAVAEHPGRPGHRPVRRLGLSWSCTPTRPRRCGT